MTIERIRSSDLEEALLVLPFTQVTSLLRCVESWTQHGWNKVVMCRVLFCLLRIHQPQIVASSSLRPLMASLQRHVRQHLKQEKVGFPASFALHV
jgi:U3 small nucleolar RNA-associated protein 12